MMGSDVEYRLAQEIGEAVDAAMGGGCDAAEPVRVQGLKALCVAAAHRYAADVIRGYAVAREGSIPPTHLIALANAIGRRKEEVPDAR